MPANTAPIYTLVPNYGFGILVTANATIDLSSNAALVFTAGANGGYLKHIRIRPFGTNAACKVAVFLHNVAVGALTGAGNTLYDEITVAATTANTQAALAGTEVPMNIPLAAGVKVYCTTHFTVTSIHVTGIGGDY